MNWNIYQDMKHVFFYFQDIWKLSNLMEEALNHSEESRFHLKFVRSFEHLKKTVQNYVCIFETKIKHAN